MPPEKRPKQKFSITLSEGDFLALTKLCEQIGDDRATRAAYFVMQALDRAKERGEIPYVVEEKQEKDSIAEFRDNLIAADVVPPTIGSQDALLLALDVISFLQSLVKEKQPTDAQIRDLAQRTNFTQEELQALRGKLFPPKEKKTAKS